MDAKKIKENLQGAIKKTVTQKALFKLNRSNLIGFVILAVSGLILLSVTYFAYQKLSSNTTQKQEKTAKEIPLYERQGRAPNRAAGEVLQQDIPQKSITEEELKGAWESLLPKGRALLEMKRGKYRLVILSNTKKDRGKYSNGTYEIINGVLVLNPDSKSKPPKTKGVKYDVLTRSKMTVSAALYKGKLIWQKPPPGTGIYIPPRNAVLDKTRNKIVVWKVLE